ncbi:hypothetical protein FS749_001425 [Ceratobasidium sp. UAMH 11750]|nr:hypothetical protein FS749_001425 [Ceratobasidium sp. UAMH 11750]
MRRIVIFSIGLPGIKVADIPRKTALLVAVSPPQMGIKWSSSTTTHRRRRRNDSCVRSASIGGSGSSSDISILALRLRQRIRVQVDRRQPVDFFDILHLLIC